MSRRTSSLLRNPKLLRFLLNQKSLLTTPYDVTVLIAGWNGEGYIGAAIDSAFTQMGVDVQVIVGDDNSSDGTVGVAIAHGAEVLIGTENLRKGLRINSIWPYAKGRYVFVMDQDDTVEPDALTEMVRAFDELRERTGESRYFLYGQTQYHGASHRLHRPPVFDAAQFYKHNPVCSNILVHRDTINADGILYSPIRNIHPEDWMYMLLLIEAGYVGHPLYDTLVLHYLYEPKSYDNERYTISWKLMREYFGPKFKPGKNL